MKLTIIEDIKKLTIEEVMKDNIFALRALGTGLTDHQLFRLRAAWHLDCSHR